MKILAIDTSSSICSVAITEDTKKIIELHSDDEKTHSAKLMPLIDEAFLSSGLTLNDMDLLACSIGPGSFTGVRIGISTIKAFTDVTNIPVVGISSLEGLAYHMIDETTPVMQLTNTLFCSLIDAKNSNVYCGLYRYYNNCLNQITDLIAENIDTVISKINTFIHSFSNQFNQITFVGDGTLTYREQLEKGIDYDNLCFSSLKQNDANSVSIAISAYKKYKNGEVVDTHLLSPLYLRKSQAERALDEKEHKEIL